MVHDGDERQQRQVELGIDTTGRGGVALRLRPVPERSSDGSSGER